MTGPGTRPESGVVPRWRLSAKPAWSGAAALQAVLPAGLAARFSRTIEFPVLDTADLVTVVERLCRGHRYRLEPDTRPELARLFDAMPWTDSFENARVARRVFEEMLSRQAYRLAGTPEVDEDELARLRPVDLPGPGR